MRLKVLFMIGSMDGGGSERQTLLLLKHLDRQQFIPHLFLKRAEGSLLQEVPDDVSLHVVDDFAQKNSLYWPGRIQQQEASQLQRILAEQAIHVVYDRTYHMTLLADPGCHALGIPRVSTIVSPPDRALPTVEKRFVALKRRRLSKAYRRSDQVIAVSHQAAGSAAQFYGLDPSSLTVLHNPVDVESLRRSGAVRPDVYPESSNSQSPSSTRGAMNLVCVGRMTSEKGHSILLDAIALAARDWPEDWPGLRFFFVGDGPLRTTLMSRASSLGLLAGEADPDERTHVVSFLGHQANVSPFVRFADGLVLPSLFEGLPNVVLEAMALSTPVIATRAGGTVELQRDAPIAFWAEPHDADSLKQAICKFVERQDVAREHCLQAERTIAEHHDLKTAIASIESHLQRVVQEKAKPA